MAGGYTRAGDVFCSGSEAIQLPGLSNVITGGIIQAERPMTRLPRNDSGSGDTDLSVGTYHAADKKGAPKGRCALPCFTIQGMDIRAMLILP
jgi:hypothetical protein